MPAHTRCRICTTPLPSPFLDFGDMPLANSFLSSLEEADNEARYPLAVTACQTCGLAQLTYVVPPEQLFRNYLYVTSTSDAVKVHADWLAKELAGRYGWTRSQFLVEVASNDGTVLRSFQRSGLRVLGVEPARNIAAMAEADGIPTLAEFFNAATAKEIAASHGRAVAILGRHVFAHVNDLHDFLKGVDILLNDEGVFLIEMPYLGTLLSHMEFDTIYHEHLSYFSLAPFMRLCQNHGLVLVDVERVKLHGGSILLHVRRQRAGLVRSGRLEHMLEEEQRLALTSRPALEQFGQAVHQWRGQFVDWMGELQRGGARFIGYGAAAKGTTLLNCCPSIASSLECILDRNPLKQGRYTPGTHLPVKPVDYWLTSRATHLVILAWNFKEEIMRQMRPFAQRGGRFVVPIPEPTVVDGVPPDPRAVPSSMSGVWGA